MAAKLLAELPLGAIVIDYLGSLGRHCGAAAAAGACGGHGGRRRAVALVAVVEVPVSWNERQAMRLWRVVEAGGGGGG